MEGRRDGRKEGRKETRKEQMEGGRKVDSGEQRKKESEKKIKTKNSILKKLRNGIAITKQRKKIGYKCKMRKNA